MKTKHTLFLSLFLMFTLIAPSVLVSAESIHPVGQLDVIECQPIESSDALLLEQSFLNNNDMHPLGLNPPNSYWNLLSLPYNGAFEGVSDGSGLYTNYYFTPGGSGGTRLYIKITTWGYRDASNSPATHYYVKMYDRTTGQHLYTNRLAVGTTTTLSAIYLNPNHSYYYSFSAEGSYRKLSGQFTVAHSSP